MAWSAAQDGAGFMYFGCDTLVSFDGDRWRPERMEPTYLVRGLDVGPNGRIWVAGVNQIGWFGRGAGGDLEYHSLMGLLPRGAGDLGDVWRVYALGNDSAIFVARERVLKWEAGRFSSWDYPGMHLLWSTRTARSVYVHYPPIGLLRIGPAGPALAVAASVIGDSEVRWLDDSGKDWLLLTSQGFKRLSAGRCTPLDTEASSFARAYTPTCVARLADGTLAVGTLQGGLAVVDGQGGNVLRVFNVRSGLPANQVYSLFLDRAGALWVMGPANIMRMAIGSDAAVYGAQSGYPPGGCDSLAEYGGSVYAAAHSAVLRLSPEPETGGAGGFTALGVTSSRFYSLLSTPSGLAVGHFHGLGLWTPEGMRAVTQPGEIVFRANPSARRPGLILASLFDRVVSVDPMGGAQRVVADGLPDYGDTVVDEPSGRVWIGTPSRGMFVAEPEGPRAEAAWHRFGPLPRVGPVLVARAGSTIVAIGNAGAYCLDRSLGRFRPIAGFPAGNLLALSNADSTGSVWAALAPAGGGRTPALAKITPAGTGAVWSPQSMEGISSLGTLLSMRAVRAGGHDELWISGTESLLRVGPKALAAQPPPPRPLVHASLRSEGRPAGDFTSGSVLPYSMQGLHIEYSCLDYGMRGSERFQTMLSGAELEWSPPTATAERDFSGLREGRYELRVRLVTDSGAVGEAAAFGFEVAPPWWRTQRALAAFGLAAALGVLGLLRLRTASLENRARALEKVVGQRTDELERANAAKSEFVANMSHEIRNPMGGIMASALALSQEPLGPRQLEMVTTLRSCATFLASLVEDVLDFAAIEAGAYKVTRSPFRPAEILGNVVVMLEPRAAGARLDVAVDPMLPETLVGDAARIQQVMVNFTLNALKFGGKTISLSARAEDNNVVYMVVDDGMGVPVDEQKNLFVRFSRLKSARNAAIPGTGLGLAVSRTLAERMGGSVGYSAAPGRGSTFFLRLPLEAGSQSPQQPSGPGANAGRVLVVEDIKYNARALGRMLRDLGFDVEFAEDGEEALARLSSASYRMVFLDCDIPRVDGIEVARRFREMEPRGPKTLVFATTADSSVANRERCAGAGMDECMTKPITPEKLVALVSTHSRPCPQSFAGSCPAVTGEGAESLDLRLILRLADGSRESQDRELSSYVSALDEALKNVGWAHASRSRTEVSSAAHRILSLARMVGAAALAGTAADIQEFAPVYTETELAEEIGALDRQAEQLRAAIASKARQASLNPVWAS